MAFSSPSFLFIFLPLFFFCYFSVARRFKNLVLLIGSLIFYAASSGYAFYVLVLSIPLNHFFGQAIAHCRATDRAKRLLIVGIILNLVPLLLYKYLGFFTEVTNSLDTSLQLTVFKLALPAGISFFTFQGLSYLVDAYRGHITPARSMIDFGMYHTSFPQLIAGPIVRYAEVENKITGRQSTIADIHKGLMQFCFGLSKKMMIADNMGMITDHIWQLPQQQCDAPLAWLAALTYMLQIFFDFSGYSDMAIGLGLVMGFRFPQNFNQPYRSANLTEFWQKWNMTLSRWFRDYVYISLGGNRCGTLRTYVNLSIVFVLCGLWHGAAYTFVLWGVYHGSILIIERILKNRFSFEASGILGHGVTFILILLGWVLFRANNVQDAMTHYKFMFGLESGSEIFFSPFFYLTPDKMFFMITGLFFALFPFEKIKRIGFLRPAQLLAVKSVAALVCFVYSIALIAANGFSPFIYFRF